MKITSLLLISYDGKPWLETYRSRRAARKKALEAYDMAYFAGWQLIDEKLNIIDRGLYPCQDTSEVSLRAILETLGWSKGKLAAYINCPERTLENWLYKKNTAPGWVMTLIKEKIFRQFAKSP